MVGMPDLEAVAVASASDVRAAEVRWEQQEQARGERARKKRRLWPLPPAFFPPRRSDKAKPLRLRRRLPRRRDCRRTRSGFMGRITITLSSATAN